MEFFIVVWCLMTLLGLDRINKNIKRMTDEVKEVKFRIQK